MRAYARIGRCKARNVHLEKVRFKCLANRKKLLGINGGLQENLLHGTRMDIDSLGKPLVGVTLPPKLFPDYLSDEYLHKKNRELGC